MNRTAVLCAALMVAALVVFGCSQGAVNPLTPGPDTTPGASRADNGVQTQLWGYYDIYLDLEAGTAEAVVNRNVTFAVNIVNILNKHPQALGVTFNGKHIAPDELLVDLSISITHPFSGNPGLNGYDVRGILVCDGQGTMQYNTDLVYPVNGTDQFMLNADGYSRWFNKTEFTVPGLFGYTKGFAASKNLTGNATLNPYKYFTDGLNATDNVFDYIVGNTDAQGVFSSGATNTRQYVLSFPLPTPGVQYGYAIVANWKGALPADHPANAPEAVACSAEVTDDIYYVDGSNKGGDLILDISMCRWDELPLQIYIESTVLGSPYALSAPEMVPVTSGDHTATWHVEIPADNITGTEGQEFWVIAEQDGFDYQSPFGVPNLADTDILAAAFRFDLFVSDTPYNQPPEIISGVDGNPVAVVSTIESYSVTANDPDGDLLTYEWWVTESGSGDLYLTGPGDGAGNLEVNWTAASVGEIYNIDCGVSDGIAGTAATTLEVTIVEPPNLPPIILSGVDGNDVPPPTAVEQYSVAASDPEMDPLTYAWTVMDMGNLEIVISGEGDGNGGLTIDWGNDVGALDSEKYLIRCTVSDPYNLPVQAMPLIVTITE